MIEATVQHAPIAAKDFSFESSLNTLHSGQASGEQNLFVKKGIVAAPMREVDLVPHTNGFQLRDKGVKYIHATYKTASMAQEPKGWVPLERSVRDYKTDTVFHPTTDFTVDYTSRETGKRVIGSYEYIRSDTDADAFPASLERPNFNAFTLEGDAPAIPKMVYNHMAIIKNKQANLEEPILFQARTREGMVDITDDISSEISRVL